MLAGFLISTSGWESRFSPPQRIRRCSGAAFLSPSARLVFGALLLLIHFFALFFYAALLCGLAVGPDAQALRTRTGMQRAAWRVVPIVVGVSLVPSTSLLAAPALPGAHGGPGSPSLPDDLIYGFSELIGRRKFKSAFSGTWTYLLWLDIPVLALLVTPLVLA